MAGFQQPHMVCDSMIFLFIQLSASWGLLIYRFSVIRFGKYLGHYFLNFFLPLLFGPPITHILHCLPMSHGLLSLWIWEKFFSVSFLCLYLDYFYFWIISCLQVYEFFIWSHVICCLSHPVKLPLQLLFFSSWCSIWLYLYILFLLILCFNVQFSNTTYRTNLFPPLHILDYFVVN